MSPNIFGVTTTSNHSGFLQNHIVIASTKVNSVRQTGHLVGRLAVPELREPAKSLYAPLFGSAASSHSVTALLFERDLAEITHTYLRCNLRCGSVKRTALRSRMSFFDGHVWSATAGCCKYASAAGDVDHGISVPRNDPGCHWQTLCTLERGAPNSLTRGEANLHGPG